MNRISRMLEILACTCTISRHGSRKPRCGRKLRATSAMLKLEQLEAREVPASLLLHPICMPFLSPAIVGPPSTPAQVSPRVSPIVPVSSLVVSKPSAPSSAPVAGGMAFRIAVPNSVLMAHLGAMVLQRAR